MFPIVLEIFVCYQRFVNIQIKKAELCQYCAEVGSLELLQMMRQLNYPWDVNTCIQALIRGHISIYLWAKKNGCDDKPKNTCDLNNYLSALDSIRIKTRFINKYLYIS